MTLYDYIKQTRDEEITVFDKDYDIEVYFYKNNGEELDSWDKSMEKLSKILTIDSISKCGVIVNLSQIIEDKLEELEKADMFISCDIDSIMESMEAIISGYVSENWLEKFVDILATNNHFEYKINYMKDYYNGFTGNYLIPVTEYTKEIENEVKEFLKIHKDYFLMYLSVDDGYEEDMWCVTNWLE